MTIRKSDKSNSIVIMDRSDYLNKLSSIVADEQKFTRLTKDSTEALKKKLNGLIEASNMSTNDFKFNKLVGHYKPGYLYGNPKTHKDLENPPLRPIISQIGTPAYEIAKSLNDLLKKYIPDNFSIESTDQFIDMVKSVPLSGLIASLDVTSLFTNVPVRETVDIILDCAYNNTDLPPPPVPKDVMKEMLLVCTTETIFRHPNGDLYKQVDGVAMGSPLGPLFANYYMGNLETQVMSSLSPDLTPVAYCRYVDDVFLLVHKAHVLYNLRDLFERKSILKFT